jgi:hypothetical protein
MSLISTAYDSMITRIEAVLDTVNQGYKRIHNPYSIQDNEELFLVKGYGLAVLTGENTQRVVNCKFTVNRNVEVILTRLYTGAGEDAVPKATLEKLLLEDQYKLINNFEQDLTINGTTMYTRWVSDSGIEYVNGETGRFFMLRTQFSLEYLETFI